MANCDDICVNCYRNVRRLRELKEGGASFPVSFTFDSVSNNVYRFVSTDASDVRAIFVTESYMCDAFAAISAIVTYVDEQNHTYTFDGKSMSIDDKRVLKYKYDSDYCYRLQKTQYKASNPYNPLRQLVDEFWHVSMMSGFKDAGYLD